MKDWKLWTGLSVITLCAVCALILRMFNWNSLAGIGRPNEYEITKDTLYIRPEVSGNKYRLSISKDGSNWEDYVDFNGDYIWNHISNLYFFPPDTLFVLNEEGKSIVGIGSHSLKIIDVLSQLTAVERDSIWILAERLRYHDGGKYVESFVPGSPRIAYRLTYDPKLSSAPVWISMEPNLDGFTVCDSTGYPTAYSEDLMIKL